MARRSPQEKKALSYAKDRRNDFGENDKGSRKSIRRNKRTPNRADRHREHQVLAGATGVRVDEVAERAEAKLLARKSMWMTKRWRKYRDAALAGSAANRRMSMGRMTPAARSISSRPALGCHMRPVWFAVGSVGDFAGIG